MSTKKDLNLWDVLRPMLSGEEAYSQKSMQVFLKSGDVADVIVCGNKEVTEDYISDIIPDFESFVPTATEVLLKAAQRYSSIERLVLKDIYWELNYLMAAESMDSTDALIKNLATAYAMIPVKFIKEDFPNIPKKIMKEVKKQHKSINELLAASGGWDDLVTARKSFSNNMVESRLQPVTKKKTTKNYYNVRDSKGRFTKKAKKRNIKR